MQPGQEIVYGLWGEGLVWLLGVVVPLHAALSVQLLCIYYYYKSKDLKWHYHIKHVAGTLYKIKKRKTFTITGNIWPRNVPKYHYLTAISCYY